MIQRCYNPNYKQYADYGGRGITVCDAWLQFSNFLSDMGQPPFGKSIERIDNSKGYARENCVWATRTQQQRNRRVVLTIAHNGKSQCLAAWCEELGLNPSTVYGRMHRGRTPLQALGLV